MSIVPGDSTSAPCSGRWAGIRGRELDLDTLRGTIAIVAALGGAHRVDHRGAIALPAAARRMCGIPTGPPVVLVADLRRQRLIVHPAAAVARLLTDDDSEKVGTGDDC